MIVSGKAIEALAEFADGAECTVKQSSPGKLSDVGAIDVMHNEDGIRVQILYDGTIVEYDYPVTTS